MLDRLTEVFCEVDDFCKAFEAQWQTYLLGSEAPPHGPQAGLAVSEIITLLLVLHSSGCKYLKHFYHDFATPLLRQSFPGMPCYEQFVTVQKRAFVPLMFFLLSCLGKQTGIYYIDSTALPVGDNHRIYRHKTFAGLAARGKTSMGWFFGFKLHLVFNNLNQIVACKLTSGQVHDTKPVAQLTKHLLGKLFGDKGYIGKRLAQELLRRGLILFTRVGVDPTVTLVANWWWSCQAACARAPKREQRVFAVGFPAHHSLSLTRLTATAVRTCWRKVFV